MAVTAPKTHDDEAGVDRLRVQPTVTQGRRPRLSWIAVGLVVALVSGVVGAVVVARVGERQPVLALAQPLEPGDTLTADHLRAVEVAADGGVASVPAADRDEVIGLTAASALPVGTLLNAEHLTDGSGVPDGWRVVGMALQPGAYPVSTLRAADRVAVVRTPDPAPGTGEGTPELLVDDAEVYAVEPLGETTRALMVSLAVPREVAGAVAAAAAADRIRLVLEPTS